MSQQKNAKNTSQVDVAFSSKNTSRQIQPSDALEVIRPSKDDSSDFKLVEQRIRKLPRDSSDRISRRLRTNIKRKERKQHLAGRAAFNQRVLDEQHRKRVERTKQPYEPRVPTTWHLPYVKPNVVDRSKRIPDGERHQPQYFVNGAMYFWHELTAAEQAHLRDHHTAMVAAQNGFAAETWKSITVTRTTPSRPPREKVEVRGGFVALERNHVIPWKLFSKERLEQFRLIVCNFLTTKQKIPNVRGWTLERAIRALNYRRTGPDRVYMNSQMATLVHSHGASLRHNIGDKKFSHLISEASLGTVNMKFGLPGPSHGTIDNDLVYQSESLPSPETPDDVELLGVSYEPEFFVDIDEMFPDSQDYFIVTNEMIEQLIISFPSVFQHDDPFDDHVLPYLPVTESSPHIEIPEPLTPVFDQPPPTVTYQMATFTDAADPIMAAVRTNSPAVARIVALLYILRETAGKPTLWLSAITVYLQPDEMLLLYDYAQTFVSAVFGDGVKYQNDSDIIGDMFASPMAQFEKTSIYRSAWQLFGSFSIHGILKALGIASDSTIIGNFFKWCSPLLRREVGGVDPLDSFLMRLVKFASLCATTIHDCIKNRSLTPLFSTDLTFHEWIDWVNFLLYDTSLLYEPGNPAGTADFEKKLAVGEVPHRITSQMTKQDIMVQLAEAIAEGESLCKRHERDSVLLSSIQRYLTTVKTERIALSLDTPHGAFRVQPFGLMICGPAGVGKSRLCHDLHMACARKSEHRADSSGVLRIDASANFADGAMRGQSTVLFDDLDAKPAPPTAGHDDHVSTVNKYINVTPFNIEQASIEKKGKVWAGFTLALYTTNHLDCRLKDYCTYPAMFWRRFVYRVQLIVKPEFANAAGGIDKEKLRGLDRPEIHNYLLQKYDPALMGHGNDYVPPYTDVQLFQSKIEFFTVIVALYKRHYDDERKMAVLANDDNSEQAFCKVCCLRLSEHPLGASCTITQQMSPPPVSTSDTSPVPPRSDFSDLQHPNLGVQVANNFIVGTVFGYTLSSLIGGLFNPPRRRGRDGVVRRNWSAWFWNSIPIRFDLTFSLFALPIHFLKYLGFLTPQVSLIMIFVGHFVIPEFDPMILYLIRDQCVDLEIWLTRLLFWPTMRFYQLLLPHSYFVRLVRYYETSRDYLSLGPRLRNISLADVQKVVLGLTAAGVAAYLWRKHTQDERLAHQSGLYKDYRRPPGVPVGETPYVRVMQDEVLMRAYGVRSNPSTFSFPEMEVKIRSRLVKLSTRNGTVTGFRIVGSLIVCNLHLFVKYDEKGMFRVSPRFQNFDDTPVSIVVGDQSYLMESLAGKVYRIPGKDLVLLHVPNIPPFSSSWNFPALLCDRAPTTQSMADEAWLVRPSDTLKMPNPVVTCVHIEDPAGPRVWKYSADTVNGDCGTVLVIRRGATFSVAGLHTARLYQSGYCLAESLSRDEFDLGVKSFAGYGVLLELQLDPKQLLGHGDLPPLTALPLKSSLRTTLSNSDYPPEVVVFGCLPGLAGASNKSRVVDTIFRNHELVVALETSLGSHPYFTAPTFGGKMYDERWVDPHTVSLENTYNRGGNRLTWEQALNDFLRGAREKIQCGPLVPLSDYDAFFGVQDTVLGGTNMQSSAGPPFYSRKSSIIRVDHNSVPKLLEWDAGFAAHLQAIESVLRSGSLYSPFCLHVLKDEVTSVVKNEKHKVRVFNILPFAFNHLMKRYLGPLVALMREHSQFFESAVGLNICDPVVAAELYDNVARHPNCIAFDKSSFDARCSTEEHLVVCRFFCQLAQLAGYSEADCDLVFTLCLSSIYPIRSIKGDLFMLACSMPTGFWMTIHFNCVRSSLQSRYAWFAMRPDAGPFRASVSQIVLGDDLLATVAADASWYNQVSVADKLLDIGALTTSFRKTKDMAVYEDIADVQFLKRQPRLVEGKRVWALDPKTLIKMLCMRLKSAEVPELDAHAMLLTNVLSESWMWGEEFFATMDNIVRALALKHRLDTNVYFRRLDFQGYLRLYVGGGLTTWEPVLSAEGELVPITESVVNQAHGLQSFSIKKAVLSS